MKVLVTGASGLIGTALVAALREKGHAPLCAVRGTPAVAADTVPWDPDGGHLETAPLEGIDAIVHLAGESIAGRWSSSKKERIRKSRVSGTKLIADTAARLARLPAVLVSASAVGYYGDRGEEVLKESSAPGKGFLAEVCQAWETAAEPARLRGIRVVNTRFGVVLDAKGGALAQMLPPFRMGAGGRVGNGKQYVSWVALDDAVAALLHALETPALAGPVNVVSPLPVTNAELTITLGKVLGRPTAMTMPAFAARLAFGEMADALLLASQRVEPARLAAHGFKFRYPSLEGALRHTLGV